MGASNPYSSQQVHTHYATLIITIRPCASIGARPHKGAHGQYGQGMTTEPDSFPRRHARTQRFTLGAPRSFTVAPDGSRVVFLRSGSGTDRANSLWVLDMEEGGERVAADPRALLGGASEDLSPEERARRERSREGGAGIVGYATDTAVELASFALSGRLFAAELRAGTARELPTPGPVIDPRPSPDGRYVAYVAQGALRVVGAEGDGDRALAEPESENVSYGLAEFIAAEEMGRSRGFWWAPESDRLLVARADDTPVDRWWISDPAHPEREPQRVAYPAAGTGNADVRLFVIGLDGARTEVAWDRARYPYLARVHWSAAGAPLLLVQARDQRSQLILAVDPESGATRMVHADEDRIWLDLFPGVPCWSPAGRLVRIADEGGARLLAVGDRPLTGAQLHVRAVLDVSDDDVLISASAGEEAAEAETGQVHVYRVNELGVERVSREPGVHAAVRAGDVMVLVSASLDRPGARVQVLRDGKPTVAVPSYAEDPGMSPRVTLTEGGARRIPCAVLMPRDYAGDTPLPAGRTGSGSSRPTTRTSPRSGSRTRGSRWSSRTAGAPRAAPPPGRRGSTTTSRSPWTTRWRPWRTWRRGIRWICPGWRSAAGPSAAGWRASRCCAGRTSSTRGSRVRR
jgi:dipeptidyl-peptidase-4